MLICVTNRQLCRGDFFARIKQLAQARPFAIMLREKDLDVTEYEALAIEVDKICKRNGVHLIIHQNETVAAKMQISYLHLPLPALRSMQRVDSSYLIGTSVHSVEEAKEAQELGANYVIAGHIYDTDSKKGLPGRGLSFLRDVCQVISMPVFAIGGITRDNVADVLRTGANGYCIMSEAMNCDHPGALVNKFLERV